MVYSPTIYPDTWARSWRCCGFSTSAQPPSSPWLQYLLGHGARTPLVTWWWWAQIMVFASKTGTFLSGKVVFLCISRSHGMDFGLPDGSRFWHRHPPYENTSSRQVVRGCQTKLGTSFFRGASFFWCSFLGSGYEAARTAGAFSTIFFWWRKQC